MQGRKAPQFMIKLSGNREMMSEPSDLENLNNSIISSVKYIKLDYIDNRKKSIYEIYYQVSFL